MGVHSQEIGLNGKRYCYIRHVYIFVHVFILFSSLVPMGPNLILSGARYFNIGMDISSCIHGWMET